MPFLPLNDRVALRRLPSASKAEQAGFILPDAAKDKPLECEVVAVPERSFVSEWGSVMPCPVEVGQKVLVGKYTSGEIRVKTAEGKEEDWLFVRWGELLGVEQPELVLPKIPDEAFAVADIVRKEAEALSGGQLSPASLHLRRKEMMAEQSEEPKQ